MKKCVEIDKAWGYGLLYEWFISSVDGTKMPCWTPEHIEELLDGFYVIPKRNDIAATVFDAEPVVYCDDCKYGDCCSIRGALNASCNYRGIKKRFCCVGVRRDGE